jgi:hypothetical protein
MARQRLTWNNKKSSAAPAVPNEGPASPAYTQPDPEADQYENGDTSSWAEDPHPGPYPNGPAPAVPHEGHDHPATKMAAIEKANLCLRLATAMLGQPATDADVLKVEKQASLFMDLPEAHIFASLENLDKQAGSEKEDEAEAEAAKTIQEEVEHKAEDKKASEDDAEEMEDSDKKASLADRVATLERVLTRFAAEDDTESRIARLERIFMRLAEDDDEDDDEDDGEDDDDDSVEEEVEEEVEVDEEAKKKAADVEATYNRLLEEEGMTSQEACGEPMMGDDYEAMYMEMMREEGMMESMDHESMDDDGMDQNDPESFFEEEAVEMDMDPMNIMALDEEERAMLAQLQGDEVSRLADEQAKEASELDLKPQPKKASTGPSSLGTVTKEASDDDALLQSIWQSAPDVTSHF